MRSYDGFFWRRGSRARRDAQALTEVAPVHADLNRLGDLLKLAIREGVPDRSGYNRLHFELADSVWQVSRAVEWLASRK